MGRMKIMRSVTIVILARRGRSVSVLEAGKKGLLGTDPVFAHQASWGWQNVGMTVKSQVACRGMQYVKVVAVDQRLVTATMKIRAKQARRAHSMVKIVR